jgi:DNA polymerase-3 subunit delta'
MAIPKFADIIGQREVITSFEQAIEHDTLHHAYLLYGPERIGKRMIAISVAAKILCSAPLAMRPCGLCRSCTLVDKGEHPDLVVIAPESEKTIPIASVKDIKQTMVHKPYYQQRVVVIIDQADMLGHEAQNALLKTLEEPAQFAHLILVSSNADGLLETIKSRCFQVECTPPTRSEMKASLDVTDNSSYLVDLFPGQIGRVLEIQKENSSLKVEQDFAEECKLLRMTRAERIVYARSLVKSEHWGLRDWIQNRLHLWYFGLRYVWGSIENEKMPEPVQLFLQLLADLDQPEVATYVSFLERYSSSYKTGMQLEMHASELLMKMPHLRSS